MVTTKRPSQKFIFPLRPPEAFGSIRPAGGREVFFKTHPVQSPFRSLFAPLSLRSSARHKSFFVPGHPPCVFSAFFPAKRFGVATTTLSDHGLIMGSDFLSFFGHKFYRISAINSSKDSSAAHALRDGGAYISRVNPGILIMLGHKKFYNNYGNRPLWGMPEFHREKGYLFFVWSNEHHPAHIHVRKGGNWAKLLLKIGKVTQNEGFSQKQVREIERIFSQIRPQVEEWWKNRFK
jgi:Domain of unknown function (DUF4160)